MGVNNMNKKYNKEMTKKLFSIDNFSELISYDEREKIIKEMSKNVNNLINDYGYQIVFDEWTEYLKDCIHTPKEAWNFMILFFCYDGHKFKVENPYPFLGILYKKLGLSLDKDPEGEDENQMNDTFDTIYIELLVQSGLVKRDDYFNVNPYYDERLKEAYDKIK